MKNISKPLTVVLLLTFAIIQGKAQVQPNTHSQKASTALATPLPPNEPYIQFDTPIVVQAPVVKYDEPVSQNYEFTNTGNAPLILDTIVKSTNIGQSNQISVTYTRGKIAPGARGKITVLLNTNFWNTFVKDQPGVVPYTIKLAIRTNIGKHSLLALKLSGGVQSKAFSK